MMESTTTQESHHPSGKIRRRSFVGYALAGGVGAFSWKGFMSRFRFFAQSPDLKPQITVSVNPLAVPRTKESSKTNG